MKKTYKRKSPSRQKYEQANPTVSARIPLATRDKLLGQLNTLNMSLSDALKHLAGEMEVKIQPLEQARNEGFRAGFQRAKGKYIVTFSCCKCGQLVVIVDQVTKAKVAQLLSAEGWEHSGCPSNGT